MNKKTETARILSILQNAADYQILFSDKPRIYFRDFQLRSIQLMAWKRDFASGTLRVYLIIIMSIRSFTMPCTKSVRLFSSANRKDLRFALDLTPDQLGGNTR